ncbi:MAG: phosphoribosyltransferase [Symploca sp. SIO1B1]|nr:phosphoribosyltransferase [Symploca sp. SIO2D2]NER21647.1 phosphoribosyltransferase [Symploca sp. SIO1C2]NER94944.1 phosphoribosyltransferase [Symploca sp. SIO1B1]
MTRRLHNRTEAGRLLAKKLTTYTNCSDVLVLALPRGGVPVASEVAKALKVPLDICLVRKLGVPNQKELAMGAIAMGGVRILNEDVVQWRGISKEMIEQVTTEEQLELERRDRLYRGCRPLPNVHHRKVILVDDGIATGSTLRAAIAVLQQQQPESIITAVPVISPLVCQELKTEVDKIVCLKMPKHLHSISLWYDDFSQTTDEEVRQLLQEANCELTSI